MPSDPVVLDFYSEHEFPVWWKITDVQRVIFDSIDEIPGASMSGKTARETFGGNQTFAFWSFGDATPESSGDRQPHQRLDETSKKRSTSTAPLAAPSEAQLLHGVDFSGGVERAGQGNSKIWIATWNLVSRCVTLESGADGGFRRADLPAKVIANKGWWVFDFPFGIARATAESLQIGDWHAWLNWCYGEDRPQGYATLRRDAARIAVEQAGVQWSIRRVVDEDRGTTWFPLFEQLYRQTIYGATDVLHPLVTEHSSEVEVLPFGQPSESKSVVVEGFPGVTIRDRLGLPATGYKGHGNDRRNRRQQILTALVCDWEVPITQQDVDRAVADTEGDAVDALVLLVACRVSHALARASWRTKRDQLEEQGRVLEGWFPS